MEEDLNLWANVGPPGVDLDPKCHHGQDPRHAQEGFSDVEGHVGGGQGDCDLDQGVVEDVGKPEDGDLCHDVSEQGTAKRHLDKVGENLQRCVCRKG